MSKKYILNKGATFFIQLATSPEEIGVSIPNYLVPNLG
jgi:hypothetical protein